MFFFFRLTLSAQENALITQQKATCNANTAREWSAEVNRCVDKQQAAAIRNQAADCNKIENLEQRKACHMQLASNDTGLGNANFNSSMGKMSDLQSQSALINTANTIVTIINMVAGPEKESECMSRKIFGITAFGGTLSDIYLKIKTKKKLDSLTNQYQIDNKETAYNAQYKALQYIRDEQKAVADIASLEKKRQTLLMIGYGAAAITAGFELATNSACYKPVTKTAEPVADPNKVEEVKPVDTAAKPETHPIEPNTVKSEPLPPAIVPSTAVAPPEVKVESTATLNQRQSGSVVKQDFTAPDGTRYAVDSSKGGSQNLYPASIDKNGNVYRLDTAKPVGTIRVSPSGITYSITGGSSGAATAVVNNSKAAIFNNTKPTK